MKRPKAIIVGGKKLNFLFELILRHVEVNSIDLRYFSIVKERIKAD